MTSFNNFLNVLVAEVESIKWNVPKWTVLGEAWIRDNAKARCIADPKRDKRDSSAHTHLHCESRHDFDFKAFIPASVIGKVT